MKPMTTKEIQQVSLNLLILFDKICRENNLKYWLAYGTLLGCIRHKGFIPWDDDIDVMMPREDYERFCSLELWNSNNDKQNIAIVTPKNTKDYYRFYAKMIDSRTTVKQSLIKEYSNAGLGIDIFPVDGLGNDKQKAIKTVKRIQKLRVWINNAFYIDKKKVYKDENNPVKKTIKWASATAKWKTPILYRIGKRMVSHVSYDNSAYVGGLNGGLSGITPKVMLKELIYGDFEGHQFLIPAAYDAYLTQIYGNYMELPPIESRQTHQYERAFWK